MALGSLASRITGFLRQVALFTVLGATVLNDSYTLANTLPNIVYELLIGGALSSMMIPLLVRAQREDPDGGEAYTRKLITLAGAALLVATAAGLLAAPLLTRLYLGGQTTSTADPQLATTLAYMLLPQIFFYGLGCTAWRRAQQSRLVRGVRMGAGAQQRRGARRGRGVPRGPR